MSLGLIGRLGTLLGVVGGALSLLDELSSDVQAKQPDLDAATKEYFANRTLHTSAPMTGKMTRHAVRTLDERMTHILRLAEKYKDDELVHTVASTIATIAAKRYGERNQYGVIHALHLFVINAIAYVPDITGQDNFQSPPQTLRLRRGDCDCFTILTLALAKNLGIPGRAKVIQTFKDKDWRHIYPVLGEVKKGRVVKWYACDGTVKKYKHPGFEVPDKLLTRWVLYESCIKALDNGERKLIIKVVGRKDAARPN